MCGIVGFVGTREAAPVLLEGLKTLEYRGYDSAGAATIDGGKITVAKKVGKVSDLAHQLEKSLKGRTGIGHTRWATTGRVTDENAHPHTDCAGQVAVVHNGIIENFQELRDGLKRNGHVFKSETDTEVLAHLVEEELRGKTGSDAFRLSVCHSLKKVVGSYACLFLWAGAPDEIIAARDGSPLILASGKTGAMAASDAVPLLGFAKEAIVLRESEAGVMRKNGEIEIWGLDGGRKVPEKLAQKVGLMVFLFVFWFLLI